MSSLVPIFLDFIEESDINDLDTLEMLKNRLDERISDIESIECEKQRKLKDFQLYQKLKSSFPKLTLEEAYKQTPDHEKYVIDENYDLNFGDCIPCDNDNCWWQGNPDRYNSFRGEMYHLCFTNGDCKICSVCYDNGDYHCDPEQHIDFKSVEEIFSCYKP